MFSQSAAEYVYVKRSLRNRFAAFSIGWIEIFADIVAAGAVTIGFAGYFTGLFGGNVLVVAIVLVIMLSLVNFGGIGKSTKHFKQHAYSCVKMLSSPQEAHLKTASFMPRSEPGRSPTRCNWELPQ